MLKNFISVVIITTFYLSIYAVTPFSVDSAHSNIGFSVPIAGGLASVSGKFGQFTVNLQFDETDITKSTVEATIKADSINTGIAGRDNHLKTADFFDVAKYPDITFKSKKVEKKGKVNILIGDFSMHGVTKEISFPFEMLGNCYDKKAKTVTPPCGFMANFKINRTDFGINYGRKDDPNFIGNMIDINLHLLAIKPRQSK
jgi:polyisoprenoid-binding protein YceI